MWKSSKDDVVVVLTIFYQNDGYTGWPKKNATLTSNNCKKMRDRKTKLRALWCKKFFTQQDDTKVVKFD